MKWNLKNKRSEVLLTAAAGVSAAEIDYATAGEEPLTYREHGGILIKKSKCANCKQFAFLN
jgi:hypothetical protein